MTSTFLNSPSHFVTSESVTEGHPDKLCDQISDSILDAILAQDPYGHVACETCTTTGLVVVMGEITTDCYVDIASIARQAIKDAGYTKAGYGFDYKACGIMVAVDEQSQDINQGVNVSLESRDKGNIDQSKEKDVEIIGAGDQGMMTGFACNETEELMPLPISLAHGLCKRLAQLRKEGILGYLGPDGKAQVTVEYSYGLPKRVDTVLISSQHDAEIANDVIHRDLIEKVAKHVIPAKYLDDTTKYLVNPSGRFVIGGPVGDTGLTGRKLQVDTYGGYARHGGGAFSGKDPTKVDRSGAYAARYVAKNVVAAGLADRIEVNISYAIGVAHPVSIDIETWGTSKIPDEKIVSIIKKTFDLRPGAIIRDLDLRRPIYKQTAAYGHLGRTDINLPWEQTDKVSALKREASIK